MTKQQEKKSKILNKLVNKMIDGDTYEWPPTCAYLIYQPMRPGKETSVQDGKSVDE